MDVVLRATSYSNIYFTERAPAKNTFCFCKPAAKQAKAAEQTMACIRSGTGLSAFGRHLSIVLYEMDCC